MVRVAEEALAVRTEATLGLTLAQAELKHTIGQIPH
jgi:hypothetical protein